MKLLSVGMVCTVKKVVDGGIGCEFPLCRWWWGEMITEEEEAEVVEEGEEGERDEVTGQMKR